MIRDASRATAAGADLVEVRFDNLYVNRLEVDPIVITNHDGEESIEKQPPIMEERPVEDVDVETSIQSLKDGIQIPVIFTCRSTDDNGHFHGDEAARAAILTTAIESGVSWVDLEISMTEKVRKSLVKPVEIVRLSSLQITCLRLSLLKKSSIMSTQIQMLETSSSAAIWV